MTDLHAGTGAAAAPASQQAADRAAESAAESVAAQRARHAAWEAADHILAVRLDHMGDVLLTTPALRALARPGRRIVLLASPAGAAVARHVPEIDAVLPCQLPWQKAAGEAASPALLRAALRLPALLRARRFDAAVIFTSYSQSCLPAALLCAQAGITLRLAICRENPYALLSDWVPEREPHEGVRHEVQRQLDLVAHVLPSGGVPHDPLPGTLRDRGAAPLGAGVDTRLSFRVWPADRISLAARLGLITGRRAPRLVVVHPGASAPSRRYPAARFAQVVRALQRQDCRVLLTGNASEQALCAELERATGAPSLAGRLCLGEFGALLEAAALLVSNNSGPVHIAAALGTPVVDLYALTNPQHTPWQVPHRLLFHDVPCRYCYRSICPEGHGLCLAGVPPEAVVAAASALLAERSDAAARELANAGAAGAAGVAGVAGQPAVVPAGAAHVSASGAASLPPLQHGWPPVRARGVERG